MSRFSQYIGDTDIIARFRVRQLRVVVLVRHGNGSPMATNVVVVVVVRVLVVIRFSMDGPKSQPATLRR